MLVKSTDPEAPYYVIFSTPRYLVLLGLNNFLSTLFSNTLSLRSSLIMRDQVPHSYKKKQTGKITVLVYFDVYIFGQQPEIQTYWGPMVSGIHGA